MNVPKFEKNLIRIAKRAILIERAAPRVARVNSEDKFVLGFFYEAHDAMLVVLDVDDDEQAEWFNDACEQPRKKAKNILAERNEPRVVCRFDKMAMEAARQAYQELRKTHAKI